MMSSEFGLSSGKSMFKILIAGEGGGGARGRGEIRGGQHFKLKSIIEGLE